MNTATEAFEVAKVIHAKRDFVEPGSFAHRKAQRTLKYFSKTHGWRLRSCTACNGSGKYDHVGSPDCGACDGKASEWYPAYKAWPSGEIISL